MRQRSIWGAVAWVTAALLLASGSALAGHELDIIDPRSAFMEVITSLGITLAIAGLVVAGVLMATNFFLALIVGGSLIVGATVMMLWEPGGGALWGSGLGVEEITRSPIEAPFTLLEFLTVLGTLAAAAAIFAMALLVFARYAVPDDDAQEDRIGVRVRVYEDTGVIDGQVLVGPYEGMKLQELDVATIVGLLGEARRDDPDAAALLTEYLDRREPTWRLEAPWRFTPSRDAPLTTIVSAGVLGLLAMIVAVWPGVSGHLPFVGDNHEIGAYVIGIGALALIFAARTVCTAVEEHEIYPLSSSTDRTRA